MPGCFLVKSRHQTAFHFRRRVPQDLRLLVGKTHLTQSLQTDSRRLAIIRARAIATQTDSLFARLRTMPENSNTESLKIDFGFKLDLNELGAVTSISITDAKAEEESAVNSAIATALQNLPRSQAAAMTAPTSQAPRGSGTITDAWNGYKAEKIKTGQWKDGENTAAYDHWPHVRTLIEVIGDKRIGDVTAEEAIRFQNHVIDDPRGGKPSNRDKRLTRVGALFRWAKKKQIYGVADAFGDLFKYPGKQAKGAKYIAFDSTDLKALFESDDYRKQNFKEPWAYWLPLLGLHTGARLNELCQLTTADIGLHEGVLTIAILDDAGKRLKNEASRRLIPIHSTLTRCGLLEYVAALKPGRIFPSLTDNPSKPGDYTKEPSREFTRYRRSVGVGGDTINPETGTREVENRKTFHSFRGTAISALRKARVPGDRRRRLAGHEAVDVHDDSYDGGDALTMFDFGSLQADIEKLKFDVTFTPYRQTP